MIILDLVVLLKSSCGLMVVDLKKERKHAVEAGRIDSAQAFLQRPFVYRGVIY